MDKNKSLFFKSLMKLCSTDQFHLFYDELLIWFIYHIKITCWLSLSLMDLQIELLLHVRESEQLNLMLYLK